MTWGILTAAALVAAPPAPAPLHAVPLATNGPMALAAAPCTPCGPPMCCLVGAPAPIIAMEVPCCMQTVSGACCAPASAAAPAVAAVAADQAESPAQPVAAEDDSVLDPAAFSPSGSTLFGAAPLDRLGLGWGAGTIGPGVLFPTPLRVGSGGFGGFGGLGSSGTNGGSTITNIINAAVPPITPIVPTAVPEPTSIAAWGIAAAWAAWRRRRRA